MFENYLEEKDPYGDLQRKEKEIRRLQENTHFMRVVEEGLLHESSYHT
jgi:hypothetical protein